MPPFVIFSDATLRELARIRPSDLSRMRSIYGIGALKLADFGAEFLRLIRDYAARKMIAMDVAAPPSAAPRNSRQPAVNATRALAINLFREGAALDDVMHQTGRSRNTVMDYLCDFIRREKPERIDAWLKPEVLARIAEAVKEHGSERLKPLYVALGEQVSYEDIRVALAHLNPNV